MNQVKKNTILIILLSAVLLVVLYNFRWFHFYLEHLRMNPEMDQPKWMAGRLKIGIFNLVIEFVVFLVVSFFNYFRAEKLFAQSATIRRKVIQLIVENLVLFFGFLLVEKQLHEWFFIHAKHGFPELYYLVFNLSLFILAITLVNLLILYRKNKRSEIENIRLKEEKTRAELNALREQISPHFFFNTLSTLSSIIRNEPKEEGLGFIQDMSNTYRYAISSGRKDLVNLNEEIEFLESYIYLIKRRFGEKLRIHIDIPADKKDHYLPPMSLQVLVENAIQHNVITQTKPLDIRIFVENDWLVVQNNLQEKQSMEGFGLGLQNLSNRFKLLAEKEILIEKDSNSFTVKLPL